VNPRIPFNRPAIVGRELEYIERAISLGNISSDGEFTRRCEALLAERGDIHRVLMAPSGTAALEMASMLADLGPGDEVIMPSFTFVSTASAFARSGAVPVFVDIRDDTLNLDESLVEGAITNKTRAIVPVHYAGVGCEMDEICEIAERHGLLVIEDAAHGIDASYRGRELGSIGHLGIYSFHETKNIVCGEGGALCVNDPRFAERAEIIRDKGTDRQKFLRGAVDKYTWVDMGSSYAAGEILCAFLLAQLEDAQRLTDHRRACVEQYRDLLAPLAQAGRVELPVVPPSCRSNGHAFFVRTDHRSTRDALMEHLRGEGIGAVFHYIPLHSSPMGKKVARAHGDLHVTESAAGRLLRLPLYPGLEEQDIVRVADEVARFFDV
jgi:dTDP-4-amino-4,6-dideoxygalactose transaminase